ncbi:hypothetical protein B4Q13_18195, partial [Lacticaseibacillus rhamnosus]
HRARDDMVWIEAEVDVAGVLQAAQKQAATCKQRHRHRDLRRDEHVTQRRATAACGTATALERADHVRVPEQLLQTERSRRPHVTRHHAAWVLPITGPPIVDGWVDVADGRIVGQARTTSVAQA